MRGGGMFSFKKVKVRKTRIFLVDLYARTENGSALLQKKNCLMVATKQGFVEFEDIKDFTGEEMKLYERNGFIAHFVKATRGNMIRYTKNIRPVYSLNEHGFASYKQTIKFLQQQQGKEREI